MQLTLDRERAERFEQVRLAIKDMSSADRASYDDETALWERVSDQDLAAWDTH